MLRSPKRLINYRAFLAAASAQAVLSVLCLSDVGRNNPVLVYITLASIFIGVAMLFVYKKYFAAALLASVCGFSFLAVNNFFREEKPLRLDGDFIFSARIADGVSVSDGGIVFRARDVTAAGSDGETVKIGAATVSAAFGDALDPLRFAESGYTVIFRGDLNGYKTKTGGIAYGIDATEVLETLYGGPEFFEGLRARLLRAMESHMPPEDAALGASLLFGGGDGPDAGTYAAFKISGLAHILAVSGFHVGVIAGAVTALLKRLGVKKSYIFFIVTPLLVFYVLLCGAATGAVRAAAMYAIMTAAAFFGRRYDGLSALCLVSIAYLCLFPAAAATLSYQLSYLASFAVMSLAPSVTKLIGGIPALRRAPRALKRALAVTASVQFVTLPVTLNALNNFSPYALPANALLIPVLAAGMCALFACAFLTAVLPFLSFSFAPCGLFLTAFRGATGFIASLPGACITLAGAGALLLLLPAAVAAGRFALSRIYVKVAFCIPLAAVAFVFLTVANAPPARVYEMNFISGGVYDETLITDGQTNVYAGRVSAFNAARLRGVLLKRRVRRLDALFLTSYGRGDAAPLRRFVETFRPAAVFIPEVLRSDDFLAGIDAAFDGVSARITALPLTDYSAGGITLGYVAVGGGIVYLTASASGRTVVSARTASRKLLDGGAPFITETPDMYLRRGDYIPAALKPAEIFNAASFNDYIGMPSGAAFAYPMR